MDIFFQPAAKHCLLIICLSITLTSCVKTLSTVYLIPKSYLERLFIIIHEEKKGVIPLIENNKKIFLFSNDGIIISTTNFDGEENLLNNEYYLIDDKGNREKIENVYEDSPEKVTKFPALTVHSVSLMNNDNELVNGYFKTIPLTYLVLYKKEADIAEISYEEYLEKALKKLRVVRAK